MKDYEKTIDEKKLKNIFIIGAIVIVLVVAAFLIFGNSGEVEETGAKQGDIDVVEEKIYNLPPADQENDLLNVVRGIKSESKVCYLTFDDGPTNEVTPAVLDVLKEKNVKATFFCLGKMLSANPEIAKRAFDEGHLLANHSYNHNYDTLYATADSFMKEVLDTENEIRNITGEEPFKLFRFPGGGYNAGDHAAEKQIYKQNLKDNGYYFADWNCLNGDAEAALRSVDELINKTKQTAIEKQIIVLMHDAATKKTTPQALGAIIDYLTEKGYEFKRIDEIDYYEAGAEIEVIDNSKMIL